MHVSLLRQTLCSRLHVDHVPLRVMVTYFGAGTEVLSERASLAVSLAGKHGGYAASDTAKFLAGAFAAGGQPSLPLFCQQASTQLSECVLSPATRISRRH